jgi:hypothetical protein
VSELSAHERNEKLVAVLERIAVALEQMAGLGEGIDRRTRKGPVRSDPLSESDAAALDREGEE